MYTCTHIHIHMCTYVHTCIYRLCSKESGTTESIFILPWRTSAPNFLTLTHRYLQHICNTLQHAAVHCNALQRTATHCNALQHSGLPQNTWVPQVYSMQHTATNCNALQHTATHCNALQHTDTHTLPYAVVHGCLKSVTAIHCNTLQHTATHCNTLQHTHTATCRGPQGEFKKQV